MRVRWLGGALVASIAALALVACGGNDDDERGRAGEGAPGPTAPSDPSTPEPNADASEVFIIFATRDFAVGIANNIGFALIDPATNEPVVTDALTVTFFDVRDSENPVAVAEVAAQKSQPGLGEEFTHLHADGEEHTHGGEDADRVVYYARAEFGYAGSWGMLAQGTLPDGAAVEGTVLFEVFEEPLIIAPGDAAIPSDNLTRFDVDDIRTIDSGEVPNDMHDVTIEDALTAGRPLVIAFSTPAFCQTRFCGPVLQEVEELHDDYADRVDFVHIEIWLDFPNELNPTVEEWLVQADGNVTEPWVYVIDQDGVVYDRWEGPADRDLMEPAVRAVAEGATYADGTTANP